MSVDASAEADVDVAVFMYQTGRFRQKPYCLIADRSSKVPDDKTLVVPQVSVDGQLGLPGDLNVRERERDRERNKVTVGG